MNGILISALLLLLIFITTTNKTTSAYRIKGSINEDQPFLPYEKGFVQNVHEIFNRTRVNNGYATSVLLDDSVVDGSNNNRLFSCPQMVGPSNDDGQSYYCGGKEYGYCDRRSGTCFCNDGYAGDDCQECEPSNIMVGGLCYPKQLCPNDCSYAGQCNYLTGVCECSDHREGDDCSQSKCSRFHQFCTHCNDFGCIKCVDGWSVNNNVAEGMQCEPCWRFDPRCRDCNADACTSCVDLLLLSIHRSGRRPQDPPLPIDELTRELSVTVPFGSQQSDAFYDAEYYELVDPSLVPLNESAMECHQGLQQDDSITCVPYNLTSHIMCGNHGTITFDSPEYAMKEDEKQIRLTVRRSGGGVGEVTVSYSIYPITAGYEDVTSTAYYTGDQTVVFRHGQIRASFLVTINDDRVMEANETFSVHLSNPTGGSRLGTQSRTIVTIIDDDEWRTCSNETTLGQDNNHDLGLVEAGNHLQFNVMAKTCAGNYQTAGGDVFRAEARKDKNGGFGTSLTIGECTDLTNGTYDCSVNATASGIHTLDVYQLVLGGLKGYYYTDNYLTKEGLDIVRADAVVNFTWGEGAVTTFGRDYVSVRWEGYVMPDFTETYTFWLDVDDHVRVWVDGIILIDAWSFSNPTATNMLYADRDLTALEPNHIIMEYREIHGNATARLLWSSANTPLSAIPSNALYYKEPIQNSPFTFQVLPADPSTKETYCHGLFEGVAGQVHSFTIEPKDRFGNRRDVIDELDIYQATVVLMDDSTSNDSSGYGNTFIPVILLYNDTNTQQIDASWTPKRAGVYQLNVTMNGDHIFGSPFRVNTLPGATFAPESFAFGGNGNCVLWNTEDCSGLHHGVAGEASSFTIEAYDTYRNRRIVGGDKWDVVVSSSSTSDATDYNVGAVETDHGNGTYMATATPFISGSNNLHVTLNGSPLKGSPFQMIVIHGKVTGSTSYVVDEKDVSSMIAMTENTVLIQAADAFGNKAIYCDHPSFNTAVTVESDDIDAGKTKILYVGGGQYEVSVTPVRSGQISLSVKLNDSLIRHQQSSPFNVTVLPGTFSATSSSAIGDGLSRARAGDTAQFIIQAKDDGGNDKVVDEAQFDVHLSLNDDDDDECTVATSFIGDGQYLVLYTCFKSGEYLLTVRDEQKQDEILGSPFYVSVSPAAMSGPYSLIMGNGLVSGTAGEVAIVKVIGRDKYENLVEHAIETIEMNMSLTSRHQSLEEASEFGNYTTAILAKDSGDGTFILDYTPTVSGKYEMRLSTFSPGGLQSLYYSTPDLLPDYLVAKSVDITVEKYWQDEPSIETKSHFGAVWNGKLSADHDEEYTIIVECNDGGEASLEIDGQDVPWQSCYPNMSVNITMNTNEAVPFTLKYKALDGFEGSNSFTVLKWSSPSVPLEIISSKYLWYSATVGNNDVYFPIISPCGGDASQTLAVGFEEIAISGKSYDFLIESRDNFGNLILDGGSRVETDVTSHEGDLQITMTDHLNGTYTVDCNTPEVTGVYFLSINMDGSSIRGSPLVLTVKPNLVEPSKSILLVDDNELIEGTAGREIRLELQTKDMNDNSRHEQGDEQILAVLQSSFMEVSEDTSVDCEAVYDADGRYNILCPAVSESGEYSLQVDILQTGSDNTNPQPIKGSPFTAKIHPGSAVPHKSEVIGGSNSPGSAGLYETFTIATKDEFGNALTTGGINFIASMNDNVTSTTPIEVIDQGNGNYLLPYRVSQPGTYEVDVRMMTSNGLIGEYYTNVTSFEEGKPNQVVIEDRVDFNNSSAFNYYRWTGFISFPHTSIFELELREIAGSCKLWLGNDLVLAITDDAALRSFNFKAAENILYEMTIEYSLNTNNLELQLLWLSRKMSEKVVVPSVNLFNSAKPIRASPVWMTVIE